MQSNQELAEELANEGVDGTATIVQMVATGRTINMQPELQRQMTVDVNGSSNSVTHTQVVSAALIGQLQPGTASGQSRSERPLSADDRARRVALSALQSG